MTQHMALLPNKINTDPNKRFVCSTMVSKVRSVTTAWFGNTLTKKEIEKKVLSGGTSQFIDDVFSLKETIGSCILICIYEEKKNSYRRRFLVSHMPESHEELKELMTQLQVSLGIKASFHTFEETVSQGKFGRINRIISEKKIFFDELIEMYLGKIKYDDIDKQLLNLREKIIFNTASGLSFRDKTCYALGLLLQTYLGTKNNIYRIADRFGNHLSRTQIKIPTEHLKMDGSLLFEFPFNFPIGDKYLKNAICAVASSPTGEPGLLIIAPMYSDGMWDGNFIECFWSILKEKVIEDIPKDFKTNADYDLKDFLLYCLKCIVYIRSAEPDLKNIAAVKCTRKNHTKIRKFYKNNSPYNITTVGYSFHGGKTFSVDETSVVGHFRLQPCGTGLTQVKLIWIDEHVRRFNKE